MVTERLSNAIKILTYAINNNLSLAEACRRMGKSESYVRNTKNEFADKENPEYKKLLELYKQVLQRTISIQNTQPVAIDDAVNAAADEELGLLSHDTIIEEEETIKNESDDTIDLDFRGHALIYTPDQLLKRAKIDLSVWKVDKQVVNKWDVTMKISETQKDENGVETTTQTPITSQNFQVKVWLSKIRSTEEQKAWDNFIATIKENAPKLPPPPQRFVSPGISLRDGEEPRPRPKYLMEVSIPDLHIGKLAWEDESGENYDTKIAIERFNECVENLLVHAMPYRNDIEEILFPIGNDLINIDNMSNKTTAGTEQRVDSRWQQMFVKAKDLMIKNIDRLSKIAPVRVVMVSGNHDYQTVYYLGCVLEAYYSKSSSVKIDNTAEQRKYHEFGVNMIGFTHGNEEKHQELGLIMATQKPEMWARTKCRQMHLGHFHSRKTTKYLDVQEFQGFTVRILPSLSGTDDWHNRKGYMSMKSGVVFLYEKTNGLVAEFSHNII